ncbi:MAG TPA: LuxR family transcriptional regulator, partial [Bradyrhizobium sp.]|nr:LuxR family transcriptional regulator [Bradyrhizobium sp.]
QSSGWLVVPPPHSPASAPTNLPVVLNDLVGRGASLQHLLQACSAYRIVTLTGPGGIGKTTLAIELARSLLPRFDAGAWLVELAPLADPDLVPLAVSHALGLHTGGGTASAESAARAIGLKRLVVVLDNCEHLIDAAAQLAETILRLAPHAVIVATSREMLRTQGEYVYRVPSLEVVGHDTSEPAELLRSSAIKLFLARAEALQIDDLCDEQHLRLIGRICRRLDGIPLAIEFAAARAATLGLFQVARDLEDRIASLASKRRAVPPRHRSLSAVFDWSYDLLAEAERLLLHRLAVFPGGFGLDAACALMHDSAPEKVVDSIVNLVEKSIVAFERPLSSGRWRLLETVRAYALDKLAVSGEARLTAFRHAEFFRDFFATFDRDAGSREDGDELPIYIREVDNLRAALAWAFSTNGDPVLGIALAVAAVNFWLAASLLDECSNWASKALRHFDGTGHDEQEMVLRTGLGQSLMFTEGMTPATLANLTRALSIAEARGNTEYRKRAVFGLWQFSMRSMELRKALQLGKRYAEFAHNGAGATATYMADLMIGMSLTYLGEYCEAVGALERTVSDHPAARRHRDLAWLRINPPSLAFGHLAICLFSRGKIDAAIRAAERSIEEARQAGQPLALCLALARSAGLLFPEVGAFDRAEHDIAVLLKQADRHGLCTFRALAACASGRVLFMRGDPASGAAALRSGLAQSEEAGYRLVDTIFRGYLAEALSAAGNADEGFREAETALRCAKQMDCQRFVPELLRIRGSVIARRQPDDPIAERMFRQAIDLARRQQALYWELRAALDLAECWQTQGRNAEGYALLAPIYQRFTEGSAAPVLVRANELLEQFGDGHLTSSGSPAGLMTVAPRLSRSVEHPSCC